MAWLMFKDGESYKHRGKKVDGFSNQIRPKINLSWGMEALDYTPSIREQTNRKSPTQKVSKFGQIYKRSEQDELHKILKKYQTNDNYGKNPNQPQEEQKNQNLQRQNFRLGTESSSEKIRFLENSLLPLNRRDTMGMLLNHEAGSQYNPTESRVSRRSNSGNKKNQSNVHFGDVHNVFSLKEQIEKDFHQQLVQRYNYEEGKKSRKISQIQI